MTLLAFSALSVCFASVNENSAYAEFTSTYIFFLVFYDMFTIANPNPEPPSDREPLLSNAQKPRIFCFLFLPSSLMRISTFSFVKLTTATSVSPPIFPYFIELTIKFSMIC
jgi:hypothetical protein